MDNNFNQQGYNPQQGYNTNGMNNMSGGSAPDFTKTLILSIVQMLCCCQITGIIALIFTIIANSAFKSGNMNEYYTKQKSAKTALKVGWIIGVVVVLLMIVFYGLAFLASLN